MNVEAPKLLSVFDFLAWDAEQEGRFELLDGLIVAMATPSRRHARLIRRLYRTIDRACGERCDVYVGDMTVRIEQMLRHSAPKRDIVVTCDERDRRFEDLGSAAISYPKLVVEVLSPRTAASDLNSKVRSYFAIPTVEEYLCVDSRERFAVLHRRSETDNVVETWPTSTIELAAIGVELSLDGLYEGLFRDETVPGR